MSNSVEDFFYALVKEYEMVEKGENVIIGTSGGADSVCLLFLMKKLSQEIGFNITAVHVNHMIRGDEADRDEAFVKELCSALKIKCVSVHADVMRLAREKKMGVEETGRLVRYKAFDMVAEKLTRSGPYVSGKVAVAHHRDDNVETILINLLRGTDLKGLTGIQPVSRRGNLTIIRPLLGSGKKDIEEYLEINGIPYVQDSTNFKDDYIRNKIRNNIVPGMREVNSRAVEHINDVAHMLLKLSAFYDENVKYAMNTVVDMRDEAPAVNVDKLRYLDPAIQRGVIYETIGYVAETKRDIGRIHVEDVLSLCDKQTGRRMELPYGVEAVRSYSNIIIRKAISGGEYRRADIDGLPIMGLDTQFSISLKSIETEKKTFVLADGNTLSFEIAPVNEGNRARFISKNEYTKAFDCDKIKGTLILGRPQKDDKIKFSGGTKTLKKFFVDEKVPQELRDDIPILKDMEGILWVMGYRIGEQYKITDSTTRALIVSVSGGSDGR